MSARGVRITGGLVLPLDGDRAAIEDGEVGIEGDRIVYLGPCRPAEASRAGVEVIDARGALVLPGLVNAHAHSYGVFAKGSVDGVPLDFFILEATAVGEALDEEDLYLAATLTAAEALRSGTTCVLDHLRFPYGRARASFRSAAQGYLDAGIRATIAPMFGDRALPETFPDTGGAPRGTPADGDAYLDACAEAVSSLHGKAGRIQFFLGTDGPQRCTPYLLRRSREFLDAHPVGMQSHVYETATQRVRGTQLYGRSLVAVLEDAGLLGPRVSLVHFVWSEADDHERVRRTGAAVVHCPGANLQVGSGIAPVPEMLRLGIPVGLGTDGANSLDLSVWSQVRLACLLHRVAQPWYTWWPTSADVLRMATAGGAAAHGLAGEIGVLRAGAKADVVLLDGASAALAPFDDPVIALATRETGASVRTVLVGGEVVVRDGRCTRIDEAALLARLAGRRRELRPAVERRKGDMAAAYRPYVERMYRTVMASLESDTRFTRPRPSWPTPPGEGQA